MKILSRVLFVAIAAGWVFGGPVTAQSKNPIQAAKDAYKKAREEQAKKSQPPPAAPQTPQTSQPSTPANTSAARPEAASGDCCSPDALRKIASSAGFLDIVGIKLGMTPEQAFAAVKAHNGQMKIEIVNARMEYPDGPPGDRYHPVPQFAVAHTVGARLGQNPTPFILADGSEDVIVLEFTIPPSPPLLARIVRQMTFPRGQLVVASNLLDALRKKYGQERPGGVSTMWMFDSAGKTVSRPMQQPELICGQSNLFAGLGGWGGGGMPRPEDMGRDAPTQLSLSNFDMNGNGIPSPGAHAPCRSFVIAEAYPLSEGIPPNQQMGQLTVAVYSSGLLYGSRKAAYDWLKAKDDAKTKQLEDAAKARSAPKL